MEELTKWFKVPCTIDEDKYEIIDVRGNSEDLSKALSEKFGRSISVGNISTAIPGEVIIYGIYTDPRESLDVEHSSIPYSEIPESANLEFLCRVRN